MRQMHESVYFCVYRNIEKSPENESFPGLFLAEKEGFELAVQALLRFWVCEAADAPVGHPTGRAVCEAEQAHP